MILDGFDHHRMLQIRPGNLHAPARSNAGMRNVAVTRNLIRSIDDDDSLVQFRRKYARALPKQSRLADARPSEQQKTLSGFDDVAQDIHRAEHGAAHTACQTDDHFPAVSDSRDAVQRAFNPGAVVQGKRTHAMDHVIEVLSRNGLIAEINGSARKAAFGLAAEVHHNFD